MLGRGSDMSLMSYGHLYVDPSTQSIHTCKNELKTSTQKQMVLLPDFECYELCHVHAEASWWIAGGNIPEESNCFANLKASSASADLNKIIREWQETYRLEYLSQASTLKVSTNVVSIKRQPVYRLKPVFRPQSVHGLQPVYRS